ncbi:MAG: thiamine-phosphate kinase [Candidatus Omnitrophota bacterium]
MRELKIINHIRKQAGKQGKGVKLGIGDDCAVLEYDKKQYLLWASDMLAEGTHFDIKKDSYRAIGRKAVCVNISDISAMGGRPRYITVSIGVPVGMKTSRINAVYDGIFGICKDYGIKVLGGDTVRSHKLVIDVSIIGFVEKKFLVSRSGAKKGDVILITGPVRNGRKEHLSFIPRLEEARFLVKRCKVNSMIDSSDGIALDMGRICAESKVGARLYEDAIPLSKGLTLSDALYYGESFELLFTMDPKTVRKLFLDLKKIKKAPDYFVIGEIVEKKEGLILVGKEGRVSKLNARGYEHI